MGFFVEQCRYDTYDEIYVAPHFDDAVYSCGARIAESRRAGARILVVTAFGDGNDKTRKRSELFGDYDARRAEERAAMARLDADYIWLNQPELLFRELDLTAFLRIAFPFLPLRPSRVQDALGADLLKLFERRLAPGGRAIFPLSIGFHPDHRIAFEIGRALHASGRYQIEFYEDVSYSFHPSAVALRLRYLGLQTRTSFLACVRDLNSLLFRYRGVYRYLTVIPIVVYVALLMLAHALFRTEDRVEGEGLPKRISRRVDAFIHDKVEAMKLYPSQTAFFFSLDDRLYDMLRERDGYYEHSWVFPPVSAPNPRLAHLQASVQRLEQQNA